MTLFGLATKSREKNHYGVCGRMTRKCDRPQSEPRRLKDGDYAALASLRRSLRVFSAFSAEAAREVGLTPQQHQAILAIRGLYRADGMTIHDLAEELMLKPNTTVELVDRLEKADLVRRERSREDRRRVCLTLTEKAAAALETLSQVHLAQIHRDAEKIVDLLMQITTQQDRRAPVDIEPHESAFSGSP